MRIAAASTSDASNRSDQARALASVSGPTPSDDPRERLLELLAEGRSGELLVAAAEDFAHIHVTAGRIAWVQRSRNRPSLRDILELDRASASDAVVQRIVEQSYATRRHFADVAVDLNVKSRTEVRACLVRHLARELEVVLGWDDALPMFIEEVRPSRASFDFDSAELMGEPELELDWTSMFPPPRPPADARSVDARFDALLDRVTALPGVSGCTVLDPRTHAVLGSRGRLGDEVAWGLANGYLAGAEEMIAFRQGTAYLVRRAGADSEVVAVVELDPAAMLPGMARIVIRAAMNG